MDGFPRLPVVGVPVKSSALSGNDSLLSIVQMPKGIPVATVAIGNAANAGLLAVRILGAANPGLLGLVGLVAAVALPGLMRIYWGLMGN